MTSPSDTNPASRNPSIEHGQSASVEPETTPSGTPLVQPEEGGARSFRSAKRGPRSHPFVVRLSDEELEEIRSQAATRHSGLAAYIRNRIFGYKVASCRGAIDDQAYQLLTRHLLDFRNAGSNLNQLAHEYNLGATIEEADLTPVLKDLRMAIDRLRLHLIQIANEFEESAQDETVWEE